MKETPRKYHLKRSRKYLPIPASWNVSAITNKRVANIYGVGINFYINYFTPSGDTFAVYDQLDWDTFGKKIVERLRQDAQFFPKLQIKQKEAGEELLELVSQYKTSKFPVAVADLLHLYASIKEKWITYNVFNPPLYFIGSEYIKDDIKIELRKIVQEEDVFENILSPTEKSWALREELSTYKAALKILKNEDTVTLIEAAQTLSETYGWIPVSYDANEYWGVDHYEKVITTVVKEKSIGEITKTIESLEQYENEKREYCDDLFQKYKLPDNTIRLIGIFQAMYVLQDERKHIISFVHWILRSFLTALADKLGVEYIVLKYVDVEEVSNLIDISQELERLYDERNRQYLLCEGRLGEKSTIVVGNEAYERFYKLNVFDDESEDSLSGSIRGIVVSRPDGIGIIRGSAKIVMTLKELKEEITDENIIVTSMTTPDFAMLIKKARGVVTDEGGVTCHAALLSREFSKPCIVGTKRATTILKDGDFIEMNLEKGIITKVIEATV